MKGGQDCPVIDSQGHPSREAKPRKIVVVTMTNGQVLRIRDIKRNPATVFGLSSEYNTRYLLPVTLCDGHYMEINPRQICTAEDMEEGTQDKEECE